MLKTTMPLLLMAGGYDSAWPSLKVLVAGPRSVMVPIEPLGLVGVQRKARPSSLKSLILVIADQPTTFPAQEFGSCSNYDVKKTTQMSPWKARP